MPKEHCWTERGAEGARREVRAVRHAAKWRIQSRTEPSAGWEYHDQPLLADLEHLKALLERKYRRRRASWDEVQEVDRLLEAAKREAAAR